ncbi:hypothetical protein XENTR_v10020980 [Xenopus tropicalis]|uniref:RING-type E3 ubiquitin transferase n=1 Tax=Xenopus tropicalis TaxID=8364 RepID=A0A8J0SXC0_XENTR|nr:E3 ubiquitin-protein ligase RNF128 isoform X1 [Xenopus tropicalis]KAE8584473.1 hypothetical protein XENTR_v10020980 [Xenopus tropicalis]
MGVLRMPRQFLPFPCLPALLLLNLSLTGADTLWTANVNYSYVYDNRTYGEEGEIGVFGQDSPIERAAGLVVLPKSERTFTACKDNTNFSVPHNWNGPWIALILRGGGCTFTEKINRAAERGARAVVVYNNGMDNEVFEMSHPGTKDTVAIMIGNIKGNEIVEVIKGGMQVMMVIEVGRKHGSWINHYSIFFVSVSFFIVTAATVGYFIFYSARRWRLTRAQNKKMKQLKAEAKKAIGKLQLRTIKQGDKVLGPDGDSCAVCIEPYKPSDVVRILTCNHFFHKNCIDPWLLEHRTCPMCKCDILKSLGIAEDEEETTSAAIPSVSSELQRSTVQTIEEENRSEMASSGYASVRGGDEPVDEGQHIYENTELVHNEASATSIEVLPHVDNPGFESEDVHVHEMKS